jgi:hypothetical protein
METTEPGIEPLDANGHNITRRSRWSRSTPARGSSEIVARSARKGLLRIYGKGD